MAGLKDIGGGMGIVDISPFTQQVLQIRAMQNREATSPIDELKKTIDTQRSAIELQGLPAKQAAGQMKDDAQAEQEKAKAIQATLEMALSGDYDGATEGYQKLSGKNFLVRGHKSKAKRDSGVVLLVDPTTGKEEERDLFQVTRIREKIQTEAAIAKEFAIKGTATPTDISSAAQQLLEKGLASSPAEAVQISKTLALEAGKKVIGSDGKSNRYASLAPETIANLAESKLMVNAAAGRTTNQAQESAANARTVPRVKVPNEDRTKLEGHFNLNKVLMRDVLPQYMEVANDSTLGTNILNTPIQSILGKIGSNDPRFLALKTLTGDVLFKRVKEESGAAFPESEWQRRRELMPNESDTLKQAIAKMSALVALNTTTANTKLQTLEATDHDIGGLKRLFSGLDLPEIPEAEAQSILKNLPKEVRENSEVMDQFVEVLPPGMRGAIDKHLRESGTPRKGGVVNDIKKAIFKK